MTEKIHSKKSSDEGIIVPLDGSKLAEVALPYAEELGARTACDIALLSILEYVGKEDNAYLQRIAKVTQNNVKKYFVIPGTQEIDVYATTRIGNPAEAIVDFAGAYGTTN